MNTKLVDFKDGQIEIESKTPEFTEEIQSKFDAVELGIATNLKPVECPVINRFTPGMYIREIRMPRGSIVTSRIHATEHPYVVSQGKLNVLIEGIGWTRIEAPYTGITKPMTRRILIIDEDTIWTTFHATDETDLDKIEEELFVKRDEHFKQLNFNDMETLTEGSKV